MIRSYNDKERVKIVVDSADVVSDQTRYEYSGLNFGRTLHEIAGKEMLNTFEL